MNRTRAFLTIALVSVSIEVLASPRDDLASPSQATRDAAAKILLTTYTPPSRTNWDSLVAAVTVGMSQSNVLETVRRFVPDAKVEMGDGGGGWWFESYRLDDLWCLRFDFQHGTNTEKSLVESMRNVWLPPPSIFTGTWTTYFVNGQRSHEIHYKDGEYEGEFTSFRSDRSKCVVQHYIANSGEGEDTGYFPSGHVMYKGVYKGGRRVGTWTWYNEDGTIKSTEDCDKAK